jgi:hypothetical protein
MAAAEALFREARELMAAGKIAEACQKFAESQRLDPSPGTLLNLARCHAQQGKNATAWAEYLSAKRAAQAANRSDLADEAQRQADALASSLSYLTISAKERVPGLVVSRNGETLETSALGSKLPVDPGRYTIKASAPGYADYSGEVTVDPGAAIESFVIPPLQPAPAAPAEASASGAPAPSGSTPPPAETKKSSPILGYVLGGVGIAATGVGIAFGVLASSKYEKAEDACPTFKNCSPAAMDERESANTFANVANVGVGVGIAAIAVGAVLIFTHDSGEEAPKHARFTPVVAPSFAGGAFQGSF